MLKTKTTVYNGDSIRIRLKDYEPMAQPVPYGTNLKGVYFDGYPQIQKQEGPKPVYKVKLEKNIMVPMRDGIRLAVDVYHPDAHGKKFPVILSFGTHGKELQEAGRWYKRQAYWDTPFWDGCMEAGNIDYVVSSGYVHVIPEPRNIGKSEGSTVGDKHGLSQWPTDIYDVIEWITSQPWCDGNVGMMGACNYARNQMEVALNPPACLKAINPFETVVSFNDYFDGIYDAVRLSIDTGRHGNDSGPAPFNTASLPLSYRLPKDELDRRVQEALAHPDIKYNSKWYSLLQYPLRNPFVFDTILAHFHPRPGPPSQVHKIAIPAYISTPWNCWLYIWGTFEAWEKMTSPSKKMMVWPPAFADRPFLQYADETVRWCDYWLKGIDNGVMDEPPIKLFVMGVNKWRFENEWPLARTEWTKYYLHPGGLLSTRPLKGNPEPDSFTQPAPYLDPAVYCLTYDSKPFDKDIEITGPIAFYLEASINIDDTNWMVDLVDIDTKGNKMLVSTGSLKAAHRALDENKSRPYQPIHEKGDPVPVSPGEKVSYAIAMMPTSNVFKKGHRMELIIRNQDDLLSRLGIWGIYRLPFMRTVKHTIHFGNSYLLLPLIPEKADN